MTSIFHITTQPEWEQARLQGYYTPSAFATEGFIHCSYATQVIPVANRIFKGQSNLVLLEIEPLNVGCEVIDENLEGGNELFPHIYGRLALSAVREIYAFPCGPDGMFELPGAIATRQTE